MYSKKVGLNWTVEVKDFLIIENHRTKQRYVFFINIEKSKKIYNEIGFLVKNIKAVIEKYEIQGGAF